MRTEGKTEKIIWRKMKIMGEGEGGEKEGKMLLKCIRQKFTMK